MSDTATVEPDRPAPATIELLARIDQLQAELAELRQLVAQVRRGEGADVFPVLLVRLPKLELSELPASLHVTPNLDGTPVEIFEEGKQLWEKGFDVKRRLLGL